jgi:hypothetical protein
MRNAIIRDEGASADALLIVEKYESYRDYMYGILQNCPREHRVARDEIIADLFAPIRGLHHASKSLQVSRLHEVDGQFATLRSHMRFLVQDKVRVISRDQHVRALALLAEPGRMLSSWKKKLNDKSAGAKSAPPRPLQHSISGTPAIDGQAG